MRILFICVVVTIVYIMAMAVIVPLWADWKARRQRRKECDEDLDLRKS